MAILEVVKAPDPRLKRVARPVAKVDDEIRTILDDMLQTMYANDGCGLAAIQVAIEKRLLVIDLREGPNEERKPYKMVNPEIIWSSDSNKEMDEGCVSFPFQYAKVRRPAQVKVKYLNEKGEEKILEADGLLAACIQHEIDHLDGILFVDRLSPLKRNLMMRRLLKDKKLGVFT